MGKGSAGREARRARKEEEARQARIKTGSESIRKMFADKFPQKYYDDALKAQTDTNAEEFNTQFERARQGLVTALMRAGIYDSTEGQTRRDAAEVEKGKRWQDVNQQALATVQGHKQHVLGAEDAVLGQLRSSGDLDAANASAAQQLAMQSEPIPFSPLGSVFQNFTAGLAEQAEQERQGTNRYNVGVSTYYNPRRYTTTVK